MTSVDPLDQVTLMMYTCREQEEEVREEQPNNPHRNPNAAKAANAAPTAGHQPGKFMGALKVISAVLENM